MHGGWLEKTYSDHPFLFKRTEEVMSYFSKKRFIAIMLLPTMIVFLAYIVLPIFISFYFSLTKYSGVGKAEFIGLKNYINLMNDHIFFVSLKNTFIILLAAVVILFPCSFLLALLLNMKTKYSNIAKALNFYPSIIAPIVVGILWIFILDPQIGLINIFMRNLGLNSLALDWIGGKTLTPYSVGIVFTWQNMGFIATIFVAGLKMIPQEIYESSSVDGATDFQSLIFITIPMLKETFLISIVLIITNGLKVFETVYQLTNGSPNHLSEVLVTYMYNVTFTQGEYGYGMSIAVVIFLLSFIFSFTFLRSNRKAVGD